MRRITHLLSSATLTSLTLMLAGCQEKPSSETKQQVAPQVVRLGYFANLTHAPAIYAVDTGLFATSLGATTKIETRIFNAGPEAIEAIFSDALDVAYVGPNPAINAFA